jgi:transposase-like protein
MEQRIKFDNEFKLMTIGLYLSGKSTSEVAAELRLHPELVSRWKREYKQVHAVYALSQRNAL